MATVKPQPPCVFCSAKTGNSSQVEPEEYWQYIQPTSWKGNALPLHPLPMCSSCSEKINNISKCHREISELEDRLLAVRNQLEEFIQDARTSMFNITTYRISPKDLELMKTNRSLEFVKLDIIPEIEITSTRSLSLKRSFDEMMASSPSSPTEETGLGLGEESECHLANANDHDHHDDYDHDYFGTGEGEATEMKAEVNPSSNSKRKTRSATRQVLIELTTSDNGDPLQEMKVVPYVPELHLDPMEVEPDRINCKSKRKSTLTECQRPYSPSPGDDDDDDEDNDYYMEEVSESEDSNSSDEDEVVEDVPPIPVKAKVNTLRLPPTKTTPALKNLRICTICDKKVPLSSHSRHMKSHTGDFAFKCKTCSITFPSRLSYSYRIMAHRRTCKTVKETVKCEVCNEILRISTASSHFEDHENEVPSKNNFTCPMSSCGKEFTWRQSVELHLREHEMIGANGKRKVDKILGKNQSKSNPSPAKSRYSCPCEICGESLPKSLSISREHMESHIGDDLAFQCPTSVCGRTFLSRYSTDCLNHMKPGSKPPYKNRKCFRPPKKCEECEEEFDLLLNLKSHLKERHEIPEEKNFTCPIQNCSEEFTARQSLEFHLPLHAFRKTGQVCRICDAKAKKGHVRKTLTPEQMEGHLKGVHKIKSEDIVQCPHCPWVFKDQGDIVDHIVSHVSAAEVDVKCHLCPEDSADEVFKNPKILRRHYYKEHQIGQVFLCEAEGCNYSTASLLGLKRHKLTIHQKKGKKGISGSMTTASASTSRRKECCICSERIPLHEYHDHMVGHVGEFAIQCQNCSLTFPSRLSNSYLFFKHRDSCEIVKPTIECEVCHIEIYVKSATIHLESHEIPSEKNFTCPISSCGKGFTWRQSVEFHLKVHENIGGDGKKKKGETRPSRPCEICGVSFQDIQEHMESHVGDFAFQCPGGKCGRTFASRYTTALIQHMKPSTGRASHKERVCYVPPKVCEECSEEFDHLKKLKAHLDRHEITQEKNFKCPMDSCDKEFTLRQSVEFHLDLHAFRRTVQICKICDVKRKTKRPITMTPEKMTEHLKDVHGCEEVERCPHCPFVFQNQEEVVDHVMSHCSKDGIKCHLCAEWETEDGVVFTNHVHLRHHFAKDHQIGQGFQCESCEFFGYSLLSLTRHRRRLHSQPGNERPHVCQICKEKPTFTKPHFLKQHEISKHGGERFKCALCAEEFLTKRSRDEHEAYVHRGVERKLFPCDQCSSVLGTMTRLNRHLRTVHATHTVNCPKCRKKCKSEDAMKEHVKKYHDGGVRVCELCGKKCKDKKKLGIHMRSHKVKQEKEKDGDLLYF